MDKLTDGQREFVAGLTELTRRTGVFVEGCGCCGSPFLESGEPSAGAYEAYGDGTVEQPTVKWRKDGD